MVIGIRVASVTWIPRYLEVWGVGVLLGMDLGPGVVVGVAVTGDTGRGRGTTATPPLVHYIFDVQ